MPSKQSLTKRRPEDKGPLHYGVLIIVFAVTGALSVFMSRLILNDLLGLEGTIWSGSWSFRGIYLLVITPSYPLVLLTVGTVFGKYDYFKHRVLRPAGLVIFLWNALSNRVAAGGGPDRHQDGCHNA
jgi:hypothetical protein